MLRLGAIALCAGALALAGCGGDDASDATTAPATSGAAGVPAGVAALVADTPITVAQVNRAIEQSRAQAAAQGQELPAAGDARYPEVEQQALSQLIQQEVVAREAAVCGAPCQVSDAEVRQEISRIVVANFDGSRAKYEAFLETSKINDAESRAIVENQLAQQNLLAQVTKELKTPAARQNEWTRWGEEALAKWQKRTVYAEAYAP